MPIKGQAFSIDFLIAFSIFLLSATVVYVYWTYALTQIEGTRETNDMIDKLHLVSQVWFKEGTPTYWDSSNVIELGLQNDHEFNQTKIESLEEIEYDKVKKLIGLEDYEFYFEVENNSNNSLFEFGKEPSDAKNVMKIKRIGILNGEIVYVTILVGR